MVSTNELVQSELGFYRFKDLPTEDELSEFYEKKYYQARHDNEKCFYDDEWLKHKTYTEYLTAKHALEFFPKAESAFDVGCGEGFLLAQFEKLGVKNLKGADYSSAGLAAVHPQFLDNFVQGDIYQSVKCEFSQNKFDVITNTNVIEHVLCPEKMLEILISGMHEDSVLVIKCPNDFSSLQEKLVNEKLVDKKWWVSYPDHLSYFNKESMTKFLNSFNLEVVSILADYPIDLFLLNNDMNYLQDRARGKIAHNQRVKTDLFLSELEEDKVINLYKAYADLGIGRNLTYYCKLRSSK